MRLEDIKHELKHKPTKQLEQVKYFIEQVIELRQPLTELTNIQITDLITELKKYNNIDKDEYDSYIDLFKDIKKDREKGIDGSVICEKHDMGIEYSDILHYMVFEIEI